MAKIAELVTKYRQGEIDFTALLAEVPTLEWGTRHIAADGEIWWTGENTIADVEVLNYKGLITEEERVAIFNAIA
jgi:hypothetical protein